MQDVSIDNRPALESIIKQFEDWRANRNKHERIPQQLWQAAVELCKDYPTTQVCRCLRLSFADLKKHMKTEKTPPEAMQFMQIDLGAVAGNWHFSCERSDGTKLSLSASGPIPVIEHLLRHFLS